MFAAVYRFCVVLFRKWLHELLAYSFRNGAANLVDLGYKYASLIGITSAQRAY